jgi:hypothetical protein
MRYDGFDDPYWRFDPKAITVANAHTMLECICCPVCECYGALELFTEPNNGGTGIVCGACNTRHPFSPEIMWIPRSKEPKPKRPAIDRAEVINRCGNHCWGCGNDLDVLRRAGVGWDAHHTRPFAKYGEDYQTIPLCKVCHELLTAAQRILDKLLSLIRPPTRGG